MRLKSKKSNPNVVKVDKAIIFISNYKILQNLKLDSPLSVTFKKVGHSET
jgi:hypothetical protein